MKETMRFIIVASIAIGMGLSVGYGTWLILRNVQCHYDGPCLPLITPILLGAAVSLGILNFFGSKEGQT